MIKISSSIFAANFLNLHKEISKLEKLGVDYIHYDIMDNHFVPNISLGPLITEQISRYTFIKGDVHLMMTLSKEKIKRFFIDNVEIITIHLEADGFSREMLEYIKLHGYKVGISIKPKTPSEELKRFLDIVDLILVMTVEPGFSGQKLIPYTMEKIKETKVLIDSSERSVDLEVDGGINLGNMEELVSKGANILVMGSYFFMNNNAEKIISKINQLNSQRSRR